MERQYIGARYVPVLYGAWDINKSYEALTIVQANNSSYTSKKPVPPGTDISNTEYWVVTGNFNGQVEEYRQRVEELSKDIETMTTGRYIFIADSYGRNVERDGTLVTGWPSRVISNMGLTDEYAYWMAVSGAGFVEKGADNDTFQTILEKISQNVEKPQTITDIVVLGGYNDREHYDNVTAAITNFCKKAKELFQNSKVHVGFVGHNSMRDDNTALELYKTRIAYTKSPYAAYMSGIEYAAPNITMYTSDDVHPNNNGEIAIANAVTSYLLGGNAWTKTEAGPNKLTREDITSPYTSIDGGYMLLTIPTITISETFEGGKVDLGLVTTGTLYNIAFKRSFPINVVVRDSTENIYVPGFAQVSVDADRHLMLTIRAQKAAGGDITDFNYLHINNQSLVIPCDYML